MEKAPYLDFSATSLFHRGAPYQGTIADFCREHAGLFEDTEENKLLSWAEKPQAVSDLDVTSAADARLLHVMWSAPDTLHLI